jgi:AraC-like DNA-binding protein
VAFRRGLEPTLDVVATESARFIRPSALPGVEALHATFVEHRYAPHIHDDMTIAYVDRGAARFDVENHAHVAAAGTVFLIPPQAVHTGEAATACGYTYRVLYLEPDRLAARGGATRLSFSWRAATTVVDNRDLARALERMHAAVAAPGAALEQGEALDAVCRVLGDVLRSRADDAPPDEPAAIRAARDYIHEHWHVDFSLDELAHAVGRSPFHLVRAFRSHVGMPPSAYRRALRVEAAKRLLKAGQAPIVVAARCGFCDQSHLNRHFKLATGVTPARYASLRVTGSVQSPSGY